MKTRSIRPTRAFAAAAFGASLCLVAVPGLAHTDDWLDTQRAPHGGQLRMAGPYHFELVTARDATPSAESAIVVHVTDHAGQKISTAGATGTATILSGRTRTTATLSPDAENRMKGAARYAAAPDARIVVSIALPGQPPEQARFAPGAAGSHRGMDH